MYYSSWCGDLISISCLFHFQKSFVPKKYFSIDRVFRNEAVDRTHLAEFHQIEGKYKVLAAQGVLFLVWKIRYEQC